MESFGKQNPSNQYLQSSQLILTFCSWLTFFAAFDTHLQKKSLFSVCIAVLAHPFCLQGPRQTLNTAKESVLDVYTRINFTTSACKKRMPIALPILRITLEISDKDPGVSNEEDLESSKNYADSHQLRVHLGRLGNAG